MTIAFFVVSLLALQAGEAADRGELTRLEQVWNEAHVKGDADALDRIWADDLEVIVPGMKVLGKADSMAMWRSGRMRFQRYESSGVQIRLYGDAAVARGRLVRERAIDNQSVQDDWQFTKTYVRRGGAWRVVSFTASPAPR